MSQPRFQSRIRLHLISAALFGLLSLAWSFPLVLHLGTHLPGESGGDNLQFVWNLWWMRTALHAHVNPFHTNYLFHPVGADLTQHTLTPLNGAIAATVLSGLSPVAAQNVLILASLFLNGFVVYLLAYRLTAHGDTASSKTGWYAAVLAGIAFGGTAPVLIRLYGHFNLVAAWVMPLAVLLFDAALRRRTAVAAAMAGLGLAVAVYSDYYYLIYSGVFLALRLMVRWWEWHLDSHTPRWSVFSKALAILVAIDLALILAVFLTGGFALHAGGVSLSMRSTFNLRVALWVLLAAWMLARWRPSIAAVWKQGATARADARACCLMAVVFVLAASPVFLATARLIGRGDYAAPRYFWRSAPPGVDVATVVLGNPLHVLYGSLTRAAYASLGLNRMESVAWLGVVAVLLVTWWWRRLGRVDEARVWRVAIVVFGVWALGPWLTMFGTSLALPLPAILLRYIPLVSNARIPGRAIVMVSLAVAMLLSMAVARAAAGWSRRRKALVAGLLVLDVAAGGIPLYRMEPPGVYSALRQQPMAGAVLELPLGIGDGFGATGLFDPRSLYFQTISERPIVGGYISRVPERVKAWYREAPVIAQVLRLSDPACPADWRPAPVTAGQVYDSLTAASIGYVVLDRTRATPRLLDYVDSWPLRLIATADGRELYALRKPE